MSNLACAVCDAPHDLDMGPDDGTCMICGGDLIEDESERGLVGRSAFTKTMTEVVAEGMAKAAAARGSGEN